MKTDIEKRNGKDHLVISDSAARFNVLHAKIEFEYEKTATIINDTTNRVINANWRIFKDAMASKFDEFATDFTKQIITSLFNQISLQDLFHMEESC